MASKPAVSLRMDPDMVTAVQALADQSGETFSDIMRRGALMVLGKCPTCGHKIERVPDGDVDERHHDQR